MAGDGSSVNILILFPKALWISKTSLSRRHAIETLMRRDDVNCVLTGQGWENYRLNETLKDNIRRLLPKADMVFWHKPLGGPGILPILRPKERMLNSKAEKIPACATFNECYWPHWRAWQECKSTGTDLVICHHQVDMERFHRPGKWTPQIEHVPQGALAQLYAQHAKSWSGRDVPAVLTGNVDGKLYPLRAAFKQLLDDKFIPGHIHPHPGHALPSLADCNRQALAYASLLGRSKAAYMCSSRHRYGFVKYVEAAMSGAVPIGDIPPDYADTLGPYIIRVESGMPLAEIDRIVNNELRDDAALEKRAALIQRQAIGEHSMEKYVTRILHHMRHRVEA